MSDLTETLDASVHLAAYRSRIPDTLQVFRKGALVGVLDVTEEAKDYLATGAYHFAFLERRDFHTHFPQPVEYLPARNATLYPILSAGHYIGVELDADSDADVAAAARALALRPALLVEEPKETSGIFAYAGREIERTLYRSMSGGAAVSEFVRSLAHRLVDTGMGHLRHQ